MKKKLLAALLSVSMVAALLAGCGSKEADNSAASNEAATTETTETTEAAESTDNAEEAAPADVDYGTGAITIWVAEEVNAFTKAQVDKFMEENPQFAGYTVTIEAVGEGDAASNMITDVEGGGQISTDLRRTSWHVLYQQAQSWKLSATMLTLYLPAMMQVLLAQLLWVMQSTHSLLLPITDILCIMTNLL